MSRISIIHALGVEIRRNKQRNEVYQLEHIWCDEQLGEEGLVSRGPKVCCRIDSFVGVDVVNVWIRNYTGWGGQGSKAETVGTESGGDTLSECKAGAKTSDTVSVLT